MKSVDHVLTFYEYYRSACCRTTREMQALLPAPVLPNQRSAVLTFECPQSYTTYLVELRYPTPNRGGFILGLDDFYNENLVPGAMISIERTENDGHYLVQFRPASGQSGRLLELEDRRQRYVFRPTTYSCGVIDESFLTEERFPNLASEKPLDEKVRRRPESVVAATFERISHKSDGPGFVAEFHDLMAAVNIERPFSERYLRSILENDETGAFARDPDGNDAYTYVPGTQHLIFSGERSTRSPEERSNRASWRDFRISIWRTREPSKTHGSNTLSQPGLRRSARSTGLRRLHSSFGPTAS